LKFFQKGIINTKDKEDFFKTSLFCKKHEKKSLHDKIFSYASLFTKQNKFLLNKKNIIVNILFDPTV